MTQTDGLVTGLKAINKYIERAKAPWLKLEDGESVKITFLQEFDKDSPNYNEDAGVLFIAPEHQIPGKFQKHALCTAGEQGDGACVGCEMDKKNPRKGWAVKGRLYVNALVDDGTKPPYVAIVSQGLSGKSITPTLAMMYSDAESITNVQCRMRRVGNNKNNTEYTLVPIMGTTGVDVSKYELYDLKRICTRSVPYEDQAEFYEVNEQPETDSEPAGFEW